MLRQHEGSYGRTWIVMDLRTLPRPGDLIAGRYRVDAMLGRGGMGAAFSATNLVTGKRVALKWLLRAENAERLHRLLREAQAAGRIHHPNIVNVYDVGQHAGSLFLVMELLTGCSLQAWIDEHGPIALDRLLLWLLPALRGIRAAHRCGVIHRDLKPANIFLCNEEDDAQAPSIAKVLDFGVSKIVGPQPVEEQPNACVNSATASSGMLSEHTDHVPTLTDSSALIGTPSYMSPEQFEGARGVDERSDVYACGVILYYALSGRRPFEADNYASLASAVLMSDPIPLHTLRPELPSSLCALVHAAMHRHKQQRLRDMHVLIEGLERFAHAPNVRLQAPVATPARGRTLWFALAFGILGWTLWWSAGTGRAGSDTKLSASPQPPLAPREHQAAGELVESLPAGVSMNAPQQPAIAREPRSRSALRQRRPVALHRVKAAPELPPLAAGDGEQVIELGADEF